MRPALSRFCVATLASSFLWVGPGANHLAAFAQARQAKNGESSDLKLTPEQAEVWNKEQDYFRYLQSKDSKSYMFLWDDRFVGWPDYDEHPVRKQDIEQSVDEDFHSSQPSVLQSSVFPKPESIVVFGDVAITYYFWPESDESSSFTYRITHTWRKSVNGWHIIGGMSCAIRRSQVASTTDFTAHADQAPPVASTCDIARTPARIETSTTAGENDSLSKKTDAAVVGLREQQQIPGTSLAVVRDGMIIKATGYGIANMELHVPVTPQTIFAAASLAKQFTATAVMLLVEQGKVSLEDSVAKYFHEAPPTWKPITIRNLLSHTSGIHDIWEDLDLNAYSSKAIIDVRHDYTEDELVRLYVKLPLDFPPGEKWDYCNVGYELLGFLIHRVTGIPYFEFLRQHIFDPLGMNATRLYSYADIIPNRAEGYTMMHGELQHAPWVAPSLWSNADGGILTNVLDLAKWDGALYTEKILKQSSLDQMWTPVKLNSGRTFPYGFGWQLNNANGHRVIWHTGGGEDVFVSISRYVDDRITIIVMNNLSESHCDTLKIADAVASIYIPATHGANPVKDW